MHAGSIPHSLIVVTHLYGLSRIIVSAPYGQASNATLQRTNSDDPTGVIYTCPIIPGGCEGLTGNGNGDDRRLYDVDGEYLAGYYHA